MAVKLVDEVENMEVLETVFLKPEKTKDYNKKLKKEKRKKFKEKLRSDRDEAKKSNDKLPKSDENPEPSWAISSCGGVDLISKPLLVSSDNKNIVVNGGDRVLVYNALSGSIVRTISTGPLLNICDTGDPNTVLVATKRKIMLWDISKVKIIKKINIFPDGGSNKHYKPEDIVDILLASNAMKVNEIYLVAKAKKDLNALYRVNLSDQENQVVKILRHVTIGSVHIGDNNNTLVAITNNKAHGYSNSSLECYDRNLRKVQNFNTDKDRPFTIVRVHPREKLVAAGDASGRIFVLTGLGDQLSPARAVLHWHSLPVSALSWSLEGSYLYSGAGERVLVKWRINDNSRPSFLPRLAGGLVGVSVGLGVSAVQLDDNSVVVLDNQDRPQAQLTGLTRSAAVWPAGLTWDSRAQAVVMNGRVGQLQVFKPDIGECVASIDITQQNYVAKERNVNPHNSEVELVAISNCGTHMATLDCCWTILPKITLKFWTFNQTSQNFSLNTQVDRPHIDGVISLSFRPGSRVELLSCGKDGRAKIWQIAPTTGTWNCSSCLTFRGMSAGAAGWSGDGTVLAVGFQHIATLWDQESRLRTSLADPGDENPILSLQFGRHSSSRLLMTATHASLITWDLLTLSPTWRLPLTTSPSTVSLSPCPSSSRLAIIHKDLLLIVDPSTCSILASLPSVNCTGAAVFAPNAAYSAGDASQPRTCLYFMTYAGVMKRVGPRLETKIKNTPIVEQASVLKALIKGKGVERTEGAHWEKKGRNDDLEAFLSLPVNTVPAPSLLQNMMVKSRLLALPKLRKSGQNEQVPLEENNENISKRLERYKDLFKFNPVPTDSEIDLKAFSKRLKLDST